ncbi:hypothetical protein [Candidatus Similichlamydia laticola]|uniref:Uncharacterized protein n=1 Tax=Candidatus Similichlamydia laticola TaxID=2170265 RepID=A0A369KE88_9BACT|nr:hypothetical protein [Candidatus Similichlamydia laticola]RDB31217.1 hypothetical protein HAT2_00697 [Candidatus Similichlamydia laticola]
MSILVRHHYQSLKHHTVRSWKGKAPVCFVLLSFFSLFSFPSCFRDVQALKKTFASKGFFSFTQACILTAFFFLLLSALLTPGIAIGWIILACYAKFVLCAFALLLIGLTTLPKEGQKMIPPVPLAFLLTCLLLWLWMINALVPPFPQKKLIKNNPPVLKD